MNQTLKTLEFNQIIEQLKENAVTMQAKMKFEELRPYLKEQEVVNKTRETSEAKRLLETLGTPPLDGMKSIEKIVLSIGLGEMLIPEQLESLAGFATASKRLKQYLHRGKVYDCSIAYYSDAIDELEFLREEIEKAIRGGKVDDYATTELKNIRRKIENMNQQITSKLESILKSKKAYLSDSFISNRDGHFVVPVKKEYKLQVSGSVIDISSTGSTYFIEPTSVSKLQDELSMLKIEESNEERKILYTLTSLAEDCLNEINENVSIMENVDFIFAKGKLSCDMNGIPAEINTKRYISIQKGRHPLLHKEECVPLDFQIGNGTSGVIITGPNTGGKTVALKTVGLLSAMAQSGLHIPCEKGEIAMNSQILCDIGDGQSISQNLSTFSAHIKSIIHIIDNVNEESLVLLDELGSGTDPAEGMGIAIAILEELRLRKCLFVATTHYPEVKDYALQAEGLINARMMFNRETLKPLYKLELGEAGESCALYIAKQLGMSSSLLERAYEETYLKNRSTNKKEKDFSNEDSFFKSDLKGEKKKVEKKKGPVIQKIQKPKIVNQEKAKEFQMGDSVVVNPEGKIGIIFQPADEKGNIGVQVQKKKIWVNYKRLTLKVSASELYPEDYDFSIIFDTVENRKKRHKMGKHHDPNLEISESN